MKKNKTKKKSRSTTIRKRPKDVWNTLRKLEGYIRKADIQANGFMASLRDLREMTSFEVKKEIINRLCRSVNGDILHALIEHKNRVESGKDDGNIEQNAVLLGVYDTLSNTLGIEPFKAKGERLRVSRDSAKDYEFEDYPESLGDETIEGFEIEVLRPGWKAENRVAVKPVVFEVRAEKALTAADRSALGKG
ncbi:MAG: hypothetical protein NTW44_08000 [Nitrospirae bacterium]|nr:hypothetical protein [Nitrospirota bacterium]